MRSDGVRIIKAAQPVTRFAGSFDHTHSYMQGYNLDLFRKTAVLMRQSRKGADEDNPESRLRQEGLARIAVEIRGDHDPLMVLPCDEGSGISGQKKIYERPKLLELWKAIQDGTVGSVIVAREDRLFRDRFLTQVSQFAEECAKRGVLVIIAGRRCYDFGISDDFNSFIRKMQEAYGYIDTHIRYMNDMQRQKKERGEWAGGLLIAPYAIDRSVLQAIRERRKLIKEFGSGEEDELFIAKASRPVIYEGWHQIAIDLFEKFKMFNFSRSRFGRYVEELPYIFPLPTSEDLQQYLFSIRMRLVPGRGYTFSASHRMADWLSNLMHMGYASAGKDSDGNRLYIEGAFDAAIPRDLFEECYGAITGFMLDGQPSGMREDHSHFVRKSYAEYRHDLLTQCFTSPDVPMTVQARWDARTVLCYFGCIKRTGKGVKRLSPYETTLLWTLPTEVFDRAVVGRLTALAEHDKKLADRVEKYYAELTKSTAVEKKSIVQDITRLEELIAHYDRLITNPAQPLTESQEKRYLGQQADAEVALNKAKAALVRYERTQPSEFIPAYYRILGKAPGEFWSLDVDRRRRMLRMLIDEIQIQNLSPHMYKLHLKWKDPVASHWDAALVYKRQAVRTDKLSKQEWTEEEDQLIRELWPDTDKLEICKAIPTKAGATIGARAFNLGVPRNNVWRGRPSLIHRALCYDDWAKSCAALNIDITTEEGEKLLERLNYYAKKTGTKQRAAIWWVLPVVQMNDFDRDLSNRKARPP
ncbi:MAG TPA: recombinase family protein [Ktedonobacteraceae bacterium]|nr:recombinase family protein [Ktedonobacteraceae bacterium]